MSSPDEVDPDIQNDKTDAVDQDAEKSFIEAYQSGTVKRYSLNRTHDPDKAAELRQIIFAEIWERMHRSGVSPIKDLEAYAKTSIKNRSISLGKEESEERHRFVPYSLHSQEVNEDVVNLDNVAITRHKEVEGRDKYKEFLHDVKQALQSVQSKITEEEFTLLRLRYEQECSYSEMGELLDKPAAEVEKETQKALKKCRYYVRQRLGRRQ